MLNRLKISLILAPLALTMLVGVYVYSLWAKERERSAELPFDATGAMNKDLVRFHKKRGSFPEKLNDLEGIIWEKKERNFASGGRSLLHRNYFYIYSRVAPHRFTLWAIPVGTLRDEGTTSYVVVTPASTRTWKGPPISLSDLNLVSAIPDLKEFAFLGMTEQVGR